MYICMYYVYVCIYVCMYANAFRYPCECNYVCMHACVYACMHLCMHVCMQVCVIMYTKYSTRHAQIWSMLIPLLHSSLLPLASDLLFVVPFFSRPANGTDFCENSVATCDVYLPYLPVRNQNSVGKRGRGPVVNFETPHPGLWTALVSESVLEALFGARPVHSLA